MAIGQLFGEYIYERCNLVSKFSRYVHHIAGKNMEFCLPTLIQIYGLNCDALTAARNVVIDRKGIGLNLLKKACTYEMKANQKLHWI